MEPKQSIDLKQIIEKEINNYKKIIKEDPYVYMNNIRPIPKKAISAHGITTQEYIYIIIYKHSSLALLDTGVSYVYESGDREFIKWENIEIANSIGIGFEIINKQKEKFKFELYVDFERNIPAIINNIISELRKPERELIKSKENEIKSLFQDGMYEEVIKSAEKFLDQNKSSLAILYHLTLAYLKLNRYKNAMFVAAKFWEEYEISSAKDEKLKENMFKCQASLYEQKGDLYNAIWSYVGYRNCLNSDVAKESIDAIIKELELEFNKNIETLPLPDKKYLVVNNNYNLNNKPKKFMSLSEYVFSDRQLSKFEFSDGSPVEGKLYITHPAHPNLYIRESEYNNALILDQMLELMEIFQKLGAKEITVSHKHGEKFYKDIQNSGSKYISANYMEVIGGSVDISNQNRKSTSSSSSSEMVFKRKLSIPDKMPELPSLDRLFWFKNRPMWKSTAKLRIEGNLLSDTWKISLNHEESVTSDKLRDISAELSILSFGSKGSVTKKSSNTVEKHDDIEWEVSVEYFSKDEISKNLNKS